MDNYYNGSGTQPENGGHGPDQPHGGGRYPYNAPYPAGRQEHLEPEKKRSDSSRLFKLALIAGFAFLGHLALRLLFATLLNSSQLIDLYRNSLEFSYIVEMAYSFICVGFPFLIVYLILKTQKDISAPVPLGPAYSGRKAVLLVFVGLGLCLAGNLAANFIASVAQGAGLGFYSYDEALKEQDIPSSAFGIVLLILHGAVTPALVEEFAFRGVLMQPLRRFGDGYAIIVSALFFGLVHGNMTQVPFAIIAGVALGYCAVVTGSLWVSILIHFLNNFLSVCDLIIEDVYGETAGIVAVNVCMYGFIAVGMLAFVIYAVKNPGFMRLRKGEYRDAKKIMLFVSPTIIISVCLLIWNTLQDIYFI